MYPYNDGKPRAWTCVLDELQHEYDIIFIVSAGNYKYMDYHDCVDDLIKDYPQFLYIQDKARIIDPAASINSVTVGGMSCSSTVFTGNDEYLQILPISKKNQTSTITRLGPGIGKSVKPEFIAYSGDQAFNTTSNRLTPNMGLGVLSLSNDLSNKGLFCYDYGTSFAAPYISHIAALVYGKYPQASNNLIRAILACSSKIPDEIYKQIEALITDNNYLSDFEEHYKQNNKGTIAYNKAKILHYTVGYGYPRKEFAIDSFENHVVLVADMVGNNSIQIDRTHIFEIPIPIEFVHAKGKKRIIVSLAFNPEVRKTRLDYAGASLSFELIRGKNLDDIYKVYASQSGKAKKDKLDSFTGKYICKMTNCGKELRERGTLQKGIFEFSKPQSDYGESYYIVVDCKKNWSTENQNYALVVTYETDDASAKLYTLIKNRIQIRQRKRS